MSTIAFTRTRQNVGRPPFIIDEDHVVRDTGRQIDWDLLGDTFVENPQTIKLNGAVAKGAVSLVVDALPIDLEIGTVLDFGEYDPVVVTASAALANAVSVGVTALSGPIPSGTVLDFGTTKFAVTTADAAAGATTIAVRALPTALAGGETATFKGGEQVAVVDVAAAAGATSVHVEEVPLSIGDNAEAILQGPINFEESTGRKVLAGTVVDLLSSGKVVPSSLATAGVTAYGILETNANEDSETDAATGYGVLVSGSFYENLLPDNDKGTPPAIPAGYKTELLARGGFWLFDQYGDNT
jgi:hypothetical protein